LLYQKENSITNKAI